MGHSQEEKTLSRERIVTAAANEIRKNGLSNLSIADIMSKAGLTHGGFYGHFKSRNDLIAAALQSALSESAVVWGKPDKRRTFARVISRYLTAEHRDKPESGCAVSALGSEVARSDPKVRAVMDAHLKKYFESIAELAESPQHRDFAIPIVCTMVGALTLSRLVSDEDLSDQVLEEARAFILSLAD